MLSYKYEESYRKNKQKQTAGALHSDDSLSAIIMLSACRDQNKRNSDNSSLRLLGFDYVDHCS